MDADLIEGVKVNNLADFSEVYQQYYTKLYGYFFEKAQSQIISKELVQTTFIKFWNHRYRLNADMDLSPQIFRIAKTTFIDLLREKARERLLCQGTEELAINLPATSTVVHPLVEEVTASLARMSPQRGKILKFRLEGWSNREIAGQLGISRKTVENQLNKAIKEIRSQVYARTDLLLTLFLIGWLYGDEIRHSLLMLC